jgi:2-(1,2-epoxy-1,2-dihydrophenyl)acetyl-CoA isomerase
VIITGAGRAFCAGGDIAFMAELMQRRNAEEFSRILGAGRRVILAIRQMTKPVIASINGPASGAGCNLALACDLRIASTAATFSQSFAKVGLHPDWGGTYFLPRLVTPNKACEMFFLGESIDAAEAERLGIVNQVVAPEELESATLQLAERLRAAPPIALAGSKARRLREPGWPSSKRCCGTKLRHSCAVSNLTTVTKASRLFSKNANRNLRATNPCHPWLKQL